MKYRIHRQGTLIGEYDEATLRALLSAGAITLSDDCETGPGQRQGSVAEVLYGRADDSPAADSSPASRVRWLAMAMVVLAGLAIWIVQRGAASSVDELAADAKHRHRPAAEVSAAGNASAEVGGAALAPAQPMSAEAVGPIVRPSLVAIVTLDAQQRPLRFGSGVFIGEGYHVLTSAALLAGAASAELHQADGTFFRLSETLRHPQHPSLVLLRVPQRGVALACAAQAEQPAVSTLLALGNPLLPGLPPRVLAAQPRSAASVLPLLPGQVLATPFASLAGIITDQASGAWQALSTELCQTLMDESSSHDLAAAEASPANSLAMPVAVDAIEEAGENLRLTLRNRASQPLTQVLVRILYHEQPAQQYRTEALEQSLREAAIELSSSEADADQVAQGLEQVRSWLKVMDVPPSEWTAKQTAQLPDAASLDGDPQNPLARAVEAARAAVVSRDPLAKEMAGARYQQQVQSIIAALEATAREVNERLLQQRQKLRETTQRLEATRAAGEAKNRSARLGVRHSEMELIETELPPGLPIAIRLKARALTDLKAEAHVLHAASR